MIENVGFSVLEAAINRYIALDPDALDALQGLESVLIAVECRGLPQTLTFYVKFESQAVRILPQAPRDADARIIGTPLGLLSLGTQDGVDTHGLFKGQIEIHGDVEIGHQVKSFFDNIDIDWEDYLAKLLGDTLAHQVGSGLRALVDWGRETNSAMQQNISEYLQEEVRHLPPREELNDFFDDVDELRMAVERLELRVQRLQAKSTKADA